VDRRGEVGIDRAHFVDRLTDHVHDAAERAGPTGTLICAPVFVTSWPRVRPSVESIAMRAHRVFTEVLRDFEHEAVAVIVGFKCREDRGQRAFERTSTTAPMTC
jgi:hypothetical protein